MDSQQMPGCHRLARTGSRWHVASYTMRSRSRTSSDDAAASRYTCRVSRLVAIGLVLFAGCAKREAAPAKQEPAAAKSPSVDRAAATEEARAQGVLGPSNQGAFDDGPDFQAKGGGGDEPSRKATPNTTASNATPKEAPTPIVGGDGGGGGGGVSLGTVGLGDVALVGKGDATKLSTGVSAALTKRIDELRTCYLAALRTKPTLAGHITLTFTIKPNGSFDEVAASTSTLKDGSLETCIIDSVKAAKLATSLGKAPVKGSISIGFLPR